MLGRRRERQAQPPLSGDPAVFGAFYRANAERVLVFFTRRVFDVEVALDLTGETFAAALSSVGQFRGSTRAEAEAWLFGIARNHLAQYYKRGQVARTALHRLALQAPTLDADEIERVEDAAELAQLRPALERALDRLPADQRQAVQMRLVDELAYDEIAQALDVSQQVVRARVSRGLRRLTRAMTDQEPTSVGRQ